MPLVSAASGGDPPSPSASTANGTSVDSSSSGGGMSVGTVLGITVASLGGLVSLVTMLVLVGTAFRTRRRG